MKLYFSKGSCSLVVRILLNELNIPCEYESVNLRTKETASGSDFFKINPKGSVPALQLDDNTILTENAAIQQYLADSKNATQLLPPVNHIQRYKVLEWLNFVATDLHKGCGVFFAASIPDQVKDDISRPSLISKLKFTDEHLSKNAYLVGNEFTLPDAYLFVILTWLPYAKIEIKNFPSLNKYFQTLQQRESIVSSLKQEGFL